MSEFTNSYLIHRNDCCAYTRFRHFSVSAQNGMIRSIKTNQPKRSWEIFMNSESWTKNTMHHTHLSSVQLFIPKFTKQIQKNKNKKHQKLKLCSVYLVVFGTTKVRCIFKYILFTISLIAHKCFNYSTNFEKKKTKKLKIWVKISPSPTSTHSKPCPACSTYLLNMIKLDNI